MKSIVYLLLFLGCSWPLWAQVNGGRAMFNIVNVPTDAHLASLTGVNVSVLDRDPNLFLGNPALLNKKMDKVVSLSYLPYVANIKSYAVATTINTKKIGPFGFSLKYLDYGNLEERAADATYLGSFNSRDFVFTLGKSYTIGVITLGANVKWMASYLDSYKAFAWAADMGAVFKHPEKDFTVGLAVKNLGKVYKQYTALSSDSLPFDVQMGLSYKPEHAPLRLSLTAHHMTRWDIVYNDPSQPDKVDENGKPIQKTVKNAERLLRHLNLALEVLPIKALSIRMGYSYLTSRELSLTDGISTAGLSLGGSVRVDRFEAAYTYTIVHRAGGMNVFTLNIALDEGFKRVSTSN